MSPRPRKFPRYQIRHIAEETDCQQCGWPLYVGDYVTTDDVDDPTVYACCSGCAGDLLEVIR